MGMNTDEVRHLVFLYRQLVQVKDIPVGAVVGIYGAGGRGAAVRRELTQQGVEIPCFIDTYKRGWFEGLNIIAPHELTAGSARFDLILVASIWWFEIEALLQAYGISHYAILKPYSAEGVVFDAGEQLKYTADFAAAAALLSDERSRRLYRELLQGRFLEPDIRKLAAYFQHLAMRWPTDRQYLDYVNFSGMQVVVEGGVWDGFNTRAFLERLSADGMIHGFEPDAEVATRLTSSDLGTDPRFLLVRKALWRTSQTLFFRTTAIGCGTCIDSKDSHENRCVDAVALDEYVHEAGLKHLDLIKMDIEGAEQPALEGGLLTIQRLRPQLAVAIYHSKDDFRKLPLWLGCLENYRHYLGHYSDTPCETVWYAIPEEVDEIEQRLNFYGRESTPS